MYCDVTYVTPAYLVFLSCNRNKSFTNTLHGSIIPFALFICLFISLFNDFTRHQLTLYEKL